MVASRIFNRGENRNVLHGYSWDGSQDPRHSRLSAEAAEGGGLQAGDLADATSALPGQDRSGLLG